MKTIPLSSGQSIPAIGLGTWKMTPDVAESIIPVALEMGYRHFDCARIYENEDGVGRGLARGLKRLGLNRDEVWVTSKLWNDCHEPQHVRPALERTLADLGLDYLDLYLIHWPVAHRHGVVRPESADDYLSLDQVPLEATWQAMLDCQAAGLARHVGVSNFSSKKIQMLIDKTGVAPAVDQVECHPYLAQNELLDYCRRNGIVLTAYSPLGSGDRPDGMRRPDEPRILSDPVVVKIAEQLELSPAQVLLAWAVNRNTVAIPKSATPTHMKENLAAADIELPDNIMDQLNALDRHYRYVDGTFWEVPGGPYTVANLWDE